MSKNPPRVNLSERGGVNGLRIRHQSLSIFLTRDEALTVAHLIADLIPRIQQAEA